MLCGQLCRGLGGIEGLLPCALHPTEFHDPDGKDGHGGLRGSGEDVCEDQGAAYARTRQARASGQSGGRRPSGVGARRTVMGRVGGPMRCAGWSGV